MKNVLMAVVMVAGLSTQARADGFVCESAAGDLTVKVYNKTQASEGTRNGAVMVLSDPRVGSGRKTIARFLADRERLSNVGASYVADVDLRFADSSRKGELIGGTKLGQLDQIHLDVDFKYSRPLEDGESTTGTLTLLKRNGDAIEHEVECTRYLKN